MPTPVSALIHAATLVTAGIYLMVRLGPLMAGSDLVILVGSLTAFMAGIFGFFQADLKRVIAFSTCSQLGYTKNTQLSYSRVLPLGQLPGTNAPTGVSGLLQYLNTLVGTAPCAMSRGLSTKIEIEVDVIPEKYVSKHDFSSLIPNQNYLVKVQYKKTAGIYLWVNKTNGKCYVGSSQNLYKRLENYFSTGFLERNRGKMAIYNALLKYGLNQFVLYILEKVPSNLEASLLPVGQEARKQLLEREDYYVTVIKPSYNIAAVLDRFVGKNHPRYGKIVSQETRAKIRKQLVGRKRTMEVIENHRKGAHSKPIYLYDALTKKQLLFFESGRGMYRALNLPQKSFARRIDKHKVCSFTYNNIQYNVLLYTKPLGDPPWGSISFC